MVTAVLKGYLQMTYEHTQQLEFRAVANFFKNNKIKPEYTSCLV